MWRPKGPNNLNIIKLGDWKTLTWIRRKNKSLNAKNIRALPVRFTPWPRSCTGTYDQHPMCRWRQSPWKKNNADFGASVGEFNRSLGFWAFRVGKAEGLGRVWAKPETESPAKRFLGCNILNMLFPFFLLLFSIKIFLF